MKLVADYFKWKDVPANWGFGKHKREAEHRLRRYLKKHGGKKLLVVRRKG